MIICVVDVLSKNGFFSSCSLVLPLRKLLQTISSIHEHTKKRGSFTIAVVMGLNQCKVACVQERAREQDKLQQSQPPHPSQAVVQQAVHSKTANRHLNAMEMIEWANTKHKQQQRIELQQQQAMEQQQRQQAQQGMGPGGMHQPPPAAAPAVSNIPCACLKHQQRPLLMTTAQYTSQADLCNHFDVQ